jgi:HSP90 family molecular chaperone
MEARRKSDISMIGQFGVGFILHTFVADKAEVVSS